MPFLSKHLSTKLKHLGRRPAHHARKAWRFLHGLNYKTLALIGVSLLIVIVVVVKLVIPRFQVKAAWWNDSWHYRQKISLTTTNNSNQSYAIIKILNSANLSALINANKLQASLNDLRFTDLKGNPLGYWIENSSPTTVTVWMVIPSVPSSGTTVYMYYGNPSAGPDSDPTSLPTGGSISINGNYRIHAFTTTGSQAFGSNANMPVDVLVVGGGGGGGKDMGGGGGGGGVVYNTGYQVTRGPVSLTVGAGGAGSPAAGVPPENSGHQYWYPAYNGQNSTFGTITAYGGGAGGSSYVNYTPGATGYSGGSGGGASGYSDGRAANTILGGSGTAGQGNAGGSCGTQYFSGGGGGAGGAGASGNAIANGGVGVQNCILGTCYYWGGGGGGAGYSQCGGNGGNGGGGGGAVCATTGGAGLNVGSTGGGGVINSQTNMPGGNGGANTGGGGGGGSHYNSNNKGGDGGSGIVIVRYTTSTFVTVGSPTSEEIGTGPIAYWNFDEGGGSTVHNQTEANSEGGLIAWYKFDETSGTANDQTGFYNAANNNVTYASGKIVNSAYFNGTNAYFAAPSGFANFTSGLTVSLWANPTSVGGTGANYSRFIDIGETSGVGGNNIILYRAGTTNTLNVYLNGVAYSVANGIVNDSWHHYAFTLDTFNNLTVYRDGQIVGQSTTLKLPANVTRTNSYIGRSNWPADSYYQGWMDDLRIYNRALSPNEIAAQARPLQANMVNYGPTGAQGGSGAQTIKIYATSGNDYGIYGWTTPYSTARTTVYAQDGNNSCGLGQWYYNNYGVERCYFEFDTSSVPAGATITNVSLNLAAIGTSPTAFDARIYKYNWAVPIGGANMQPNYTAAGAVLDQVWQNTANITGSGYYSNSVSLDPTWINRTGMTRYQLRSSRDDNSLAPAAINGTNEQVGLNSSRVGSSAPYLAITYTLGGGNPTWNSGAQANPNQIPMGKSLHFNGASQYLEVPANSSIGPTNAVSVTGWFKLDNNFSTSSDSNQGIFDKGDYQFYLDKSDGKAKWVVNDSTAKAFSALGTGLTGPVTPTVFALTVWNGNLYAGGVFTTAGGVTVNGIAKWDGSNWSALGTGMGGANMRVNDLTVWNGNLYAGGYFTTAGGVTVNGIAKWDGSNWSALGTGIAGGSGFVDALAVWNGNLYAGGSFATAGGVTVNGVAKWNGSSWSALGSGLSNYAMAMAIFNGNLYVGGMFATAGGVTVNGIAKWDGSNWSALGTGMAGASPSVSSMTVYNGYLYAGGYFSTANGVSANNIAKWDGTNWSALGSGTSSYVWSLGVYNGNLYAGGPFVTAGGVGCSSVAMWNGTNWSALGSGANNYVTAIAAYNGNLYAGGSFATAGGVTVNGVAKWGTSNYQSVASATSSWNSGQWYHYATVYDGTYLKLYINGVLENTALAPSSLSSQGYDLFIGKTYGTQWAGGSGEQFQGYLDETRLYNYALTPSQVFEDFNRNNSVAVNLAPKLPPSNPGTANLVGWWKFDEGVGTSALDSSGHSYTSTLGSGNSSPTWSTGKINSALSFNGTNNYADLPNAAPLQLTNSFTLEAWVKRNVASGTWERIVTKSDITDYDYWMELDTNSAVNCGYKKVDTTSYYVTGGNTVPVGVWTHLVCTFDATKGIASYINGVNTGGTVVGVIGSAQTSTRSLNFGRLGVGGTWYYSFNGSIDNVKIFNRPLTSAEVQYEYSGSADNGLVAWWKMDDGGGYTIDDVSGNNNTGSFGAGASAPSWGPGKFGGALNFTAGGQYVSVANNPGFATPFSTITGWVYPKSYVSGAPIFNRRDLSNVGGVTFEFSGTAGYIRCYYYINGGWNSIISTSVVPLNQWSHTACSYDGSNINVYLNGVNVGTTAISGVDNIPASPIIYLGRNVVSPSVSLNGYLDNVKVFNRALTAAEIATDMGVSPVTYLSFDEAGGSLVFDQTSKAAQQLRLTDPTLVAYYEFEEGSGAVVNDLKGSNNAYFGAGTSIPSWDTTTYKFGHSDLYFNGSTSKVDVPNNPAINFGTSNNFTISAWVNRTNNTGITNDIFSKMGTDNGGGYKLGVGGMGEVYCQTSNGVSVQTSSTAQNFVNAGTGWHHLAISRNGSSCRIYVDGVDQTSNVGDHSAMVTSAINAEIGAAGNGNPWGQVFWGNIDSVKIYNRALPASEITAEYNRTNFSDIGYLYNPPATWTDGALPNGSRNPMGHSLTFNGANQNIIVPNSTLPSSNQPYSVSVWINPAAVGTNVYVYGWGSFANNSDNALVYYYNAGNSYVTASNYVNDLQSPAGSIKANQWNHVVVTYTGSVRTIYINGKSVATDNPTAFTVVPGPLYIGSNQGGGGFYTGKIDEFKVFAYPLTAAEVAVEYNQGKAQVIGGVALNNPNLTVGTTSSLTAWYKFDEGIGGVAGDFSGNNNPVYISNAGWDKGKFGGSLFTNGSSSYASAASTANNNFAYNQNFSVSFWTKTTTTAGGCLVEKWSNAGGGYPFVFRMNSGGNVPYFARYDTVNNPTVTGTSIVNDNQWHHIAGVKNGSTLYLYVDGILNNTAPDTTSGTTTNAYPVYIGVRGGGSAGTWFNGNIDNLKIYNRALTPSEVSFEATGGTQSLVPAAYWNFDEKEGSVAHDLAKKSTTQNLLINPSLETTTGIDYAGNHTYSLANGGVFGNRDAVVTAAAAGNGSNFFRIYTAGFSTYSTGTTYAVSFYAKSNSGNTSLVSTVYGSAAYPTYTLTSSWQRYSYIVGDSTQAYLYFWLLGAGTFEIDNIQFEKSSTVSPYCDGSLVGSGNSWVGTLNGSASNCHNTLDATLGTGNSAPTWVTGKYGNALSFNGTSQYATAVSPSLNFTETQPFTISAWVRRNTTGVSEAYYAKQENVTNEFSYGLSNSSDKAYFWASKQNVGGTGATGTTSLAANTWYYLTGVYDGTNLSLYVNGKLESTAARNFSNSTQSLSTINIGRAYNSTSYTNGQIDELKIYPYALTPDQIQVDMNHGLAYGYVPAYNPPGATATPTPSLHCWGTSGSCNASCTNAGTIDSTQDIYQTYVNSTTCTTYRGSVQYGGLCSGTGTGTCYIPGSTAGCACDPMSGSCVPGVAVYTLGSSCTWYP